MDAGDAGKGLGLMAKRESPSRTTEGASEAGPADPRPLRREVWLGALLVLVVVFGLRETEIWRPEVVLDGRHNIQIAEAAAWREGLLPTQIRTPPVHVGDRQPAITSPVIGHELRAVMV